MRRSPGRLPFCHIQVWSAAFSPDGKRVATVSADGTSVIWEPNSGKRLLTLAGKADVSTATGKAGSRRSSPMKRIESGAGGLIMSKEEAMGAAEIEKLRKKLRQRDEEIKMLKKHIGQVCDGCSIRYSSFFILVKRG